MRAIPLVLGILIVAAVVWLAVSMRGGPEPDVVLYCGVDPDQSQRLVDDFREASGLVVDYHGETEAFRSIGLPQRIEAERDRPRGDVWWSNEIMHMVDLASKGLIDKLPEGMAGKFPQAWRDPGGRYIQFGARARVLLVNTVLVPDPADHPKSVRDLLDPKWAQRDLLTTMAVPLTGTTYTHAVAWLTRDETDGWAFFEAVRKAADAGHMKLVKSNGQVMSAVADTSRRVAFGLTDTDDAWIAINELKAPVTIIYPDQGPDEPGALLIPNTAGLITGRPHPEAAVKLLEWLASPELEQALAFSRSAQIPVRPGVGVPPDGHVKRPGLEFRAEEVDWTKVGANRDRWRDRLAALLQRGD
ncbi:MAG: extracellular solute-binding protein [Planctomycetota bacterium]